MDLGDILNAIREVSQEKNGGTDYEYETLHRLKKCHVKIAVTRKEYFACRCHQQLDYLIN